MKRPKRKEEQKPQNFVPTTQKIRKAMLGNLTRTARSRIFKKRAAKAREILESLVESKAEPATII